MNKPLDPEAYERMMPWSEPIGCKWCGSISGGCGCHECDAQCGRPAHPASEIGCCIPCEIEGLAEIMDGMAPGSREHDEAWQEILRLRKLEEV